MGAIAAIVGGIAAAGITAGVGAATAPGSPDYGAANREGVLADIYTLPTRRLIEALARTGGQQRLSISGTPVDVNFTGLGDADIAARNARTMARELLSLQQQYGPQYIAEARRQLQLSDPEGVAGRERLYGEIMGQLDQAPDTEMSQLLRNEIMSEVQRGGELDPEVAREVEQNVRRGQTARGNILGNAAVFQEAQQVGQAAEQRRSARQQKALQFLTSGASPQDIEYRRFQQNIGNLGSFLHGQTPTAQFSQLSGAQNQAAPFMPGPAMQTNINPNAGQQAANFAQQNYAAQSQQTNPWLAGIGIGLQTYGTIR
jgi:hypothetical protein